MKKSINLVLYFLLFYAAYTFDLYLESIGVFAFSNQILSIIVGLLKRFLIWTLPIFLMVKDPLDYLKLRKNIFKNLMIGSVIGCMLGIIKILWLYLFKGSFDINLMLSKHIWVEVILFVGLSEEIVFRGFLLQQINTLTSFWRANFITSFLFLVTHLPYWILIQHAGIGQILQNSFSVVGMILFLGFIFKKTESLWSCIALHSWNNFISEAIK